MEIKAEEKKRKRKVNTQKKRQKKIVSDERVKGHVILEIFARFLNILKLEILDGKN